MWEKITIQEQMKQEGGRAQNSTYNFYTVNSAVRGQRDRCIKFFMTQLCGFALFVANQILLNSCYFTSILWNLHKESLLLSLPKIYVFYILNLFKAESLTLLLIIWMEGPQNKWIKFMVRSETAEDNEPWQFLYLK